VVVDEKGRLKTKKRRVLQKKHKALMNRKYFP